MQFILKDLFIDTESRVVRRNNADIKLPDLSFDVLVALVDSAPEPIGTETFSKEVWGSAHVSDETVAQRITLLRKAIGDNPKKPQYIRTVRGLGYAIVGSIERVAPLSEPRLFKAASIRNGIIAAGLLIVVSTSTYFINSAGMDSVNVKSSEVKPESSNNILIDRAQAQLNLHQATETSRAIDMLREALLLEPDRFDARLTLSFALSTKATKFGGSAIERREAETIARALTTERPDSSNAWSALAYALSSQGRLDESLSAYQVASHLDPGNAPAVSSLAHLHLLRGELHQALLLEQQAKKAGGSSRYAEIQIAQSLELIEHPAAKTWQQKALSLNPGQVVVISEVARSYLRKGDPKAALAILAETNGADQLAPQILQLRGRAEYTLGETSEARKHFEAAGDWGQYELAAISALQGDLSLMQQISMSNKHEDLENDPTAITRILLAEIFAAAGRESEALQLISDAVQLGWRDANWLNHSPFVGSLMTSEKGQQIKHRIQQELMTQRRLIMGSIALRPILTGNEI